MSYGLIGILVISRCAAPPYPAAPDFLHRKGGGASHQRGECISTPIRAVVRFSLPQAAAYKTPSEPARSAGRTHRSVRSTRTIEPGRRRRLNPQARQGLSIRACQPSGILESTAPVPIPTAPQAPEPSSPIGLVHKKPALRIDPLCHL